MILFSKPWHSCGIFGQNHESTVYWLHFEKYSSISKSVYILWNEFLILLNGAVCFPHFPAHVSLSLSLLLIFLAASKSAFPMLTNPLSVVLHKNKLTYLQSLARTHFDIFCEMRLNA